MIQLTLKADIPQVQVSPLCLNKMTVPGTKLKGLTYTAKIPTWDDENELFNKIVYPKPFIVFTDNTYFSLFCAKNKEGFTARELCDCIRDHEFDVRNKYETVDAHNRFFEGLYYRPDGSFSIDWGS